VEDERGRDFTTGARLPGGSAAVSLMFASWPCLCFISHR